MGRLPLDLRFNFANEFAWARVRGIIISSAKSFWPKKATVDENRRDNRRLPCGESSPGSKTGDQQLPPTVKLYSRTA